jgi:4'-phosphopantetheinyl transferase
MPTCEPAEPAAGHRTSPLSLWLWQLDADVAAAGRDWWLRSARVSGGEMAAAETRAHANSRLTFLAGRALARLALASVARCRPEELKISDPSEGKPRLLAGSAAIDRHFNLSHSGMWVACAVGGSPVGLDIEPVRRNARHALVAAARFSEEEAAWVGDRGAASARRFSALWTVKEAHAKAIGAGLAAPMSTIRLRASSVKRCEVSSPLAGPMPWHCLLERLEARHWLAICCESAPVIVSWSWVSASSFNRGGHRSTDTEISAV